MLRSPAARALAIAAAILGLTAAAGGVVTYRRATARRAILADVQLVGAAAKSDAFREGRWARVADDNGVTLWLDTQSVVREAHSVRAWFQFRYPTPRQSPETGPWSRMLMHVTIDCAARTLAIGTLQFRTEADTVVESVAGASTAEPIAPDTRGEHMSAAVCQP